jgi:hypothetical protein
LRQESADARYSDLLHNNDINSFSSSLGSNPEAQRVQGPIQKKQNVSHPFHFRVFECMLGLNLLVVSFGLEAGGAGQKLLLGERNHGYRPNPLGKKKGRATKGYRDATTPSQMQQMQKSEKSVPKNHKKKNKKKKNQLPVCERKVLFLQQQKLRYLCRQRKVPSI